MLLTIPMVTDTITEILMSSDYATCVKRVGVFGSVARGNNTATSDLDLLIDCVYEDGSFDYFYVCDELRSAFKKKYRIELSLVEAAALGYAEHKYMADEIERDVVWIWQETKIGTEI